MQREDLVDLYRSRYLLRAVVSIMGDISRAEAAAIAESLTKAASYASKAGDMSAGGEGSQCPKPKELSTLPRKAISCSPIRDSAVDDPDYFPLLVGNYILGGGGFTSRLMEEIRQKRGLAYSVHSHFSPLRKKGPFEISLQTRKEQSGRSARA